MHNLLGSYWGFANMRNWRVIFVSVLCVQNTRENSVSDWWLTADFFSAYDVWHRNRQRFTVRSLNRGIGNRTAVVSNTNHHATQRHLMANVMGYGWLLESQGNLFFHNEMWNGVKRHEQCLHCST
jgi:hypothetical protein